MTNLLDPTTTTSAVGTIGVATPVLTTVFALHGQHIKQFPWFQNHWLKHLLPFEGLLIGIGILVWGSTHHDAITPLGAVMLVGTMYGLGVGANVLYDAQKKDVQCPENNGPLANIPIIGGILSPGPDQSGSQNPAQPKTPPSAPSQSGASKTTNAGGAPGLPPSPMSNH